jgi:hypothetical protein
VEHVAVDSWVLTLVWLVLVDEVVMEKMMVVSRVSLIAVILSMQNLSISVSLLSREEFLLMNVLLLVLHLQLLLLVVMLLHLLMVMRLMLLLLLILLQILGLWIVKLLEEVWMLVQARVVKEKRGRGRAVENAVGTCMVGMMISREVRRVRGKRIVGSVARVRQRTRGIVVRVVSMVDEGAVERLLERVVTEELVLHAVILI